MARILPKEKVDLRHFDLRLSFLTEEELISWDLHDLLYNNIWFESHIAHCDPEYTRLSLDIIKKYDAYKDWMVKVSRKHQGYCLANDNGCMLNTDLMNTSWMIFKKLCDTAVTDNPVGKDIVKANTTRESIADQLYELIKNKDPQISEAQWLNELFPHSVAVWEKFLDYSLLIYTVGNIVPTTKKFAPVQRVNVWPQKLQNIKDQHLYVQDTWEDYIKDNYLEDYIVDGKIIEIEIPLLLKKNHHFREDERYQQEMIDFLDQLISLIEKRAKRIPVDGLDVFGEICFHTLG